MFQENSRVSFSDFNLRNPVMYSVYPVYPAIHIHSSYIGFTGYTVYSVYPVYLAIDMHSSYTG